MAFSTRWLGRAASVHAGWVALCAGCAAAPPHTADDRGARTGVLAGDTLSVSEQIAVVPRVEDFMPEPPEPIVVFANELVSLRAALFSPDGSLLAVDDELLAAPCCVEETAAVIHLYETSTWKERVVVTMDGALLSWRFSPSGDELVAATQDRARGGDKAPVHVTEVDTRSGQLQTASLDYTGPSFGGVAATVVDPTNRFEASAAGTELRIVDPATRKPVVRLGRRADAVWVAAQVLDGGQKVLFGAMWSKGAQAAWNIVTGEAATPTRALREDLWRQRAKPAGDIGLLGGDPDAPEDPAVQGARVVRTSAGCSERACWISVGDSLAQVFAGQQPGTAIAFADMKAELLGEGAESEVLCMRGPEVVALSECRTTVLTTGLVGAIQRAEYSAASR